MSPQLDITRIKQFVRRENQEQINLPDILRLAELMTDSMLDLLKDNDTKTYDDLKMISYHISDAKRDLADLRADEMREEQIPQAGRELDAVANAITGATDTIMESAEEIMSADPSDPNAYRALVNEKVTSIFEACSFQDITGQRITKVMKTLNLIDEQITGIISRMDVEENEKKQKAAKKDGDGLLDGLLNGPALAGEGVNQDDVDLFFG